MTTADTTIAFVLYPGLRPLDLVGPLQALSPLPRIDPTFEVVVVGETTDVLPTDSVVKLAPSHTFDEVPSPFVGRGRRDRHVGLHRRHRLGLCWSP